MTTDTAPSVKSVSDFSWLKHHILLLAITGASILGGVYLIESLLAKHDAQNSAKWSAVYATQSQLLQQEKSDHAAEERRWDAQNAALAAQMSQLAATVVHRNQQAQVQVTKDATLDAQEAAARLTQQTRAAPGEVVPQGGTVIVDLPITRSVVSRLDLLPVAQADLADTQKQLAEETTVATNSAADAAAEKKVNDGFQTVLTDANKSCDARIVALRASNRKANLKSFIGGVGVTLAAILGHVL